MRHSRFGLSSRRSEDRAIVTALCAFRLRDLNVVSTVTAVERTEEEEVVIADDLEVTTSDFEFSRRFWEVDFTKDKMAEVKQLAQAASQATKELVEIKPKKPSTSHARKVPNSKDLDIIRKKAIPIAMKLDFSSMGQENQAEQQQESVGNVVVGSSIKTRRKAIPDRKARLKAAGLLTTGDSQEPDENYKRIEDSRLSLLLKTARGKLLTADEEKYHGAKVQTLVRLRAVKEELKEKLGRTPTMVERAAEEGIPLKDFEVLLKDSKAARTTMVKRNMRLVVSLARRYQKHGTDVVDLVSEGVFGLYRAVEKFDPSKGFKFSTYAHWWVRQAISRSMSDQSRVVRIPVHVYELATRAKRVEESMQKEGVRPSKQAVADALGVSRDKLLKMEAALKGPLHFDAPMPSASGAPTMLHEVVEDPKADDPADVAVFDALKNDLENVLDTLYPRERNILRLRYGLDDGMERTLVEVGTFFNITRERVRQIEAKAVRKLREPDRCGMLLEYSEGLQELSVRTPGRGAKGLRRA
ncbi:hypothetical protein BSKO_06382 [Bryopsis sp. KO-2023]|nr:hypothetical protein BSKO_06382 [Bryopsis sp. KO-2023]